VAFTPFLDHFRRTKPSGIFRGRQVNASALKKRQPPKNEPRQRRVDIPIIMIISIKTHKKPTKLTRAPFAIAQPR
jgi:hypothetical protein